MTKFGICKESGNNAILETMAIKGWLHSHTLVLSLSYQFLTIIPKKEILSLYDGLRCPVWSVPIYLHINHSNFPLVSQTCQAFSCLRDPSPLLILTWLSFLTFENPPPHFEPIIPSSLLSHHYSLSAPWFFPLSSYHSALFYLTGCFCLFPH